MSNDQMNQISTSVTTQFRTNFVQSFIEPQFSLESIL